MKIGFYQLDVVFEGKEENIQRVRTDVKELMN